MASILTRGTGGRDSLVIAFFGFLAGRIGSRPFSPDEQAEPFLKARETNVVRLVAMPHRLNWVRVGKTE